MTKTIAYAYNLNRSVSQIQYPGGRLVSYFLDTAGRLAAATDSGDGTTYAYSGTYAPQGGLASVSLNGNLVTYAYNNRLKPTTLQVNSGTTLNLAYSYFANGNVNLITNNRSGAGGRSQTLTYDNLNRVATAQSQATSGTDCWGQSFGYDRYGNLTSASSTKCSSPALSLSVNSKNQITNTGFTYDSAGNLTGDGVLNYTWDAENHLKSTNGVNYTYDGDLRRVEKSNGKLYWYSTSGQILEETDLSGNLLNDYIFFGGQRIARRDASGGYYAFFADALGSARAIIHGTLCYDADFYPFGGERIVTNTCAQNYKFTGLERDAESGLDHTLHRQYASTFGRWLSPDPKSGSVSNPQSLNRYAYVRNNACNATDPLGLFAPGPCIDPNAPGCGNPFIDEFFFTALGLFGSGPGPVNPDLWDIHHDKPEHDPCDERNPKNKRYLDFIRGHLADAKKLAGELHDLVQDVLGLSALESGFGGSNIAGRAHNFFGLKAPAPGETGTYLNAEGETFASFPSATGFLSSGQSFVAEVGRFVTGVSDARTFADTLHHHGFGVENPDYVNSLINVIGNVAQRLDCPQLKGQK